MKIGGIKGLVPSPLGEIIPKQVFIRRDVLRERLGQPGIVEEVLPVYVLAGHVTSPTPSPQRVGERIRIEPTAAISHGVGHIAVDPADVGFDSEFDLAVVAFAMD